VVTSTTAASERAVAQQERSTFSAGRLRPLPDTTAKLYDHTGPPVPSFEEFDTELAEFLAAPADRQQTFLAGLRADPKAHGCFLHTHLATIYAYAFGYRDGPCTQAPNDELETALIAAKFGLSTSCSTLGGSCSTAGVDGPVRGCGLP
jgi:hypothetical protein